MVSSSQKKYKYFIFNKDYDHKNEFKNSLPKISAYVKSYDGEIKWMYFLLKMVSY